MNVAPNLSYDDEHSPNCQHISLDRNDPKILPATDIKYLSNLNELGAIEAIKGVFKSSKFGYGDTSSVAVASNLKNLSLLQTNSIADEHKSQLEDKEQVIESLKKAVGDDILIPSTFNDEEVDKVHTEPEA